MSVPLVDAVEQYLRRDMARFHMPGHKGALPEPYTEAARRDITEVVGADSLYEAEGAIARTEARYAELYGAAGSLLSAGGSTLCIQTMLALVGAPGDRIICGRGSHSASVNAMALLGLEPAWIFPDIDPVTGLARAVTAAQVDTALDENPDAAAVYLTSPDYFGVMSDIAAIASICRSRGTPLLVDNAHGAHLAFLQPSLHPIALGADMCCDSLHKTLPVLTGGAMLHIADSRFTSDAKRRMSLFGSTSPSYLIMLSAAAVLPWLEGGAKAAIAATALRVAELESAASERGFLLPADKREPLRLSLGYEPAGLDKAAFREHLDYHRVEPEYLSDRFCVFLASTHNTDRDFARLRDVIETAPACTARTTPPVLFQPPERVVPLRDAVLARGEVIATEKAVGRVCAAMVAACPPGIPIAIPGERLDKTLCESLLKCGISSLNVLK